MPRTKISIHFHRIVALWAFIECSLGGLAHAFKLPFTALYVGGGSMFCLTLIARHVGATNIFQALVTVLSIKFLLNPHSPIGAYLAVSFQAVLGYVLFRFSPFFYFNAICLFCIGFLESALQKVAVMSLLYGKNLYKVLDKVLKDFAEWIGLGFLPNAWSLFAIYITFYGILGLFIGLLVGQYVLFLEKGNFQKLFLKNEANLAILESKKTNKRVYASIFFLVSLLIFLYCLGEEISWWSAFFSVFAIIFWFSGVLPIIFSYFLPKQLVAYQMQVLDFLPQIRKIWNTSYSLSLSYKFPRRIFTFLHIFVVNVLFTEK